MVLRPYDSFDRLAEHVSELVDLGSQRGAELLLLPELATWGLLGTLPGYRDLTAADMPAAFKAVFPPYTSRYEQLIRDLAQSSGTAICGGSHWRQCDDGRFRNTAVFASPDGTFVRQDKLQPTKPEVAVQTEPGDYLEYIEVAAVKMAILVCADLEFPELARSAMRDGADVLLAPSLTYNRRGASRVRSVAIARAVENQVFVAIAALVGGFGVPVGAPLFGTGSAMLLCPIDRLFGIEDGVLASGAGSASELMVADLDISRLHEAREVSDGPRVADARFDLYDRLRTVRPAATSKGFSWPLRVRYQDVDAQGIVYHSRYIEYLDVAFTEYVRSTSSSYASMVDAGFDPSLVQIHVDYHSPAKFDELLHIHVRPAAVGRSSLTVDYAITRDATASPLLTARTIYVNYDTHAHTARLIPDSIKDQLLNPDDNDLGGKDGGSR
jgi:YbgC/YbaW family acyl-CoA thioester hydrolase